MFAVAVSAISCASRPSNEGAVRIFKMVPSDITEFSYTDVLTLRTDDDLAEFWSYIQEEMFFDESIDSYSGSDEPTLFLIEGSYVEEYIAELNQTSDESFEYKGIRIWQDESYDVALINGTCISGYGETVRQCIDVVQGEQASLYDKFKDIVDRLPNGFVVSVVDWETIYGEQPGEGEVLIAEGRSVTNEGANNRTTKIFKCKDTDSARLCVEMLKARDTTTGTGPTSITQDGIFVKQVITGQSY